MIQRHCGSVPVVDADSSLVGIVTLRDVLLPLYPNYGEYIHDNVHARDFEEMEEGYGKVLDMTAGEVMTADPFTVAPDEPILKAASYMGLKNLRHIPVADKGKLIGVITISDINQALFFNQAS
ncbi:MAG: CBS domain-containing protein [Mariprofundaceae bacterium]|nr:CBS domain-containing protein [Mariprofundaceae bacterium]